MTKMIRNHEGNIEYIQVAEPIEVKNLNTKVMLYSEYKNNYSGYKTVKNSYDAKHKTIEVIMVNNGLCPKCHTYCYGDCEAN